MVEKLGKLALLGKVTLNADQRLYVIKESGGYSTFGWDNAYRDALEMHNRLAKAGVSSAPPTPENIGTLAGYAEYHELLTEYAKCSKANSNTWFSLNTPTKVRRVLEAARESGDILRIFLGDPETGRDWCEENDVVGFVGRTGGIKKCLILLEPLKEYGDVCPAGSGSMISTDHVLRIANVTTNEELYRHEKYELPQIVITEAAAGVRKQGCRYAANRDGKNIANFKTYEEALRYQAFMLGASYIQYPFRTVAEYRQDFAEAA